eukprot:scaffold160309_cov57-Attheya_sp.AAC.5
MRTICTWLLQDGGSYKKVFADKETADGSPAATPRASASRIFPTRTITSPPWTSLKHNDKIILFVIAGSAMVINLGYLDANESPSRLLSVPDKNKKMQK